MPQSITEPPVQSRAAAVTELVGEDLLSSESGYETALWLLYSVLDPLLHDGLEIGDSDRHMVEKGASQCCVSAAKS
jgi:hypothetical protein